MSEENAGGLGGLNIGGETNPQSGSPAAAGSASSSVIEGRQKRKYTKREGSGKVSNGGSIPPLSPAQFQSLYAPELWGKVLSAPGDAAHFATGNQIWEIKAEERKLLGETGSVAAQCFAVSDPRWLAASLALVALIDVYGTRAAIYYAEKKREAKEKAEKK